MTQSEVITKLTRECCLALGDFDHYETVRTYIQMALAIGIEHYNTNGAKHMEEVVALYKDGNEAGRFKSVTEACEKLNLSRRKVDYVLAGQRASTGGLTFIKAKDYDVVQHENNNANSRLHH